MKGGDYMIKFLKNITGKTLALALAFGGFLTATATHAAADADLVSALASTSAMATDNKGSILEFFVAVGVVVLVIAVAKGGLNWAIRKISASVGGGRRRGR